MQVIVQGKNANHNEDRIINIINITENEIIQTGKTQKWNDLEPNEILSFWGDFKGLYYGAGIPTKILFGL